ncbi:DoxX family protein [Agaribacter marinus]|uniref:Quinol oxidase n=1 Tax=Agaribacter marinus TaxID=1431249 RepID=A0AA37T3H9_9ALTE|nr:DoxX family protein [Agaribacter marinus]GLR72986.1 quinol oxidase [Agaribacter marinus]
MKQLNRPELSALISRITLGVVMIAHSFYLKLAVFTLPGTAEFFTSIGLPAALAYVVFTLEALGGIALIIGFQARMVSLLLIPVLMGATWAHAGNGWLFTNTGGGWEYPLVLVAMAITQIFSGNGAYAIANVNIRKIKV